MKKRHHWSSDAREKREEHRLNQRRVFPRRAWAFDERAKLFIVGVFHQGTSLLRWPSKASESYAQFTSTLSLPLLLSLTMSLSSHEKEILIRGTCANFQEEKRERCSQLVANNLFSRQPRKRLRTPKERPQAVASSPTFFLPLTLPPHSLWFRIISKTLEEIYMSTDEKLFTTSLRDLCILHF